MRQVLFAMAFTVLAAPAFADVLDREDRRPPAYEVNCNCMELQRRVRGLEIAAYRAPMGNYERERVRREAYEGGRYLAKASYTHDQSEKDRLCSLGNQEVDYAWVRWQPWLARNGYDHSTPCENPYPVYP